MAYRNELAVEKSLVWITELPFENKPRRSPNFCLLGSEWYLMFSFKRGFDHHVLSLHRVSEVTQQLDIKARTSMVQPEPGYGDSERQVTHTTLQDVETDLWQSGDTGEIIFQHLSSLYQSGEIKFVCRFYGQPQSALQLQTGTADLSATSEIALTDLECLSRDLGRLQEGGHLPDVRLNCGGRSFPAHRSLLAARSEVFAAMFRNEMAESRTGEVDLKDADPDVALHFLQYLYSGKLTAGSGNEVANVFAMADKYAVDSLKRACTRWILGGLTEGNCADQPNTGREDLKKEAIACACAHPEVMLSQEWAELTEKNPQLALEVYQCFVRSKTKV